MPSAPSPASESREIRVFISSTFRDFMEERELLAKQVFPALNRRARERGVELVEVDLRWGVTQEQAEDGHVLEICLREIERCRPYFIGMLGDSYGSLTPQGEASYTDVEIGHSLELLRDPAMEGRAFFYFRDPAWSDQKADAGEAGWRSDEPQDRQRLERLRERIRSSGYPLVEGLQSPQAIAERIEADLWALIDRLFPEEDQPDALEREARKHADYRKARTGAGQYIGGEAYIAQLEVWIEQGEQQILITGESGSGKSALIANWMERHAEEHPGDLVYAHHLGCTNDANALRPMLGRLIDTASEQLLEAGLITEALAVPEDWWDLVAKVAETLQTLGRWCQQEGRRWIWVLDGLDRLDPDDQNALPWLPQILPDGVQVVASALACPAREILSERAYTTLTIEPLAAGEQEQLIQRYLQRYTKELDGGLRQQILNHPLAGSPLFLKVLLEELRQCGLHDTLQQQLAFYLSSQTVDDLYERVLDRLENDGSGEAVRKVMTALWASRAGLTEPELLAITDLKPLQWAPIDLALEKAFGYNGNRLVFAHDYLRIAVEDRYLPGGNKKRQAHAELSDWFSRSSQLINSRIYEELPWQYLRSKKIGDLRDWLLDPWNLAGLGATQGSREVLEFWEEIRSPEDAGLDEIISRDVGKEVKNCFREIGDRERLASAIADILEEAGLHGLLLLQLRKLLVEWSRFAGDDLYITSLARLAYEQYCQGFHLEASKLAQECLKLGRYKLRGAWLASLLYELAVLQERKGEVEEALSLYQQCLNIEKELYKTLRPDMLATMERIARLKMKIGRKTEGKSLYLACIEGYHALLGKEHSSSISAVRNFVASLLRYGTPCHSLPLIRQHVDWCSEKKGSRSIEYLEANRLLAVALRETGRLKDAEAAFDNIISSLENVSDATGRKELRRALGGLAKTLEVAGKLQEAATYYQLALDHRHRYEGDTAWITNLERLDLARVLHRLNRTTEALTHLADLERSIQSIHGPDDDDRQLLEDALTLRHSIQAG